MISYDVHEISRAAIFVFAILLNLWAGVRLLRLSPKNDEEEDMRILLCSVFLAVTVLIWTLMGALGVADP